MGCRNRDLETLLRLENKTLDATFATEAQQGLGCSLFEAHALVDLVREVYQPSADAASHAQLPGSVCVVAVDADEGAGKPIRQCCKRRLCLTVHRGRDDDRLLHEQGPAGFRRARIPTLCQQALSQGGLLTAEDLAYRIFFVSPRTISRDLRALRTADPKAVIPLRSTVHDIGPVLTHRTEIVRLALEGKTTTQICRIVRHCPEAVSHYLSTFTRCAYLADRDLQVGQIAFLLQRGRGLIAQYLALLAQCKSDKNMGYHLAELLRLGGGEKDSPGRKRHG